MIYHLCKVKDKSVIGPQRKRHTFENTAKAVTTAAVETVNPFFTSKNGKVTPVKPPLIPYGKTRIK
ncbi:hypothetical protein BSYN_19450 [Bacteroides sedimenti]|uniref:Uncharacterized protein n=1 Tax=Bacteroides sedimenti TaxID=2136147 RepID=A0ABN6Z569_9BACE